MNEQMQYVLEKTGEAYYLHKKLAEQAQQAAEAVEYLEEEGLFDDQDC